MEPERRKRERDGGAALAALRLLLLAVLAAAVFAGCGSGSAEPEAAVEQPGLAAPIEPLHVHEAKSHTGAPPSEQPGSAKAELESEASPEQPASAGGPITGVAAVLRTYLAQHFIYASWYPQVGRIDVSRTGVTVSSWHLGGGRSGAAAARRICEAVLKSRQVSKAWVRYGERGIVVCP